MKRLNDIFAALGIVTLMFSCTTEQPDGSQYAADPELTVSPTSVVFPVGGGVQKIYASVDGVLLASSSMTWLTVSVDGSVATLTAPKNESLDERHTTVTLVCGDEANTIQVMQLGVNSDNIWPTEYAFPYQGGSLVLQHDKSGGFKFDIDVDWLSAEFEESQITITAEQNPWRVARTGNIDWTVGDESGSIAFTQAANPSGKDPDASDPLDFQYQSGWKPYYTEPEDDGTKAVIGVDASGNAGAYFMAIVSKADVTGTSDSDFLNTFAFAELAQSPTLHTGSASEEITRPAAGEYFLYVIGVGSDGKPNATYAVTEFEATEPQVTYGSWLGNWTIQREDWEYDEDAGRYTGNHSTVTDTWQISRKEDGKTFYIMGMEDLEYSYDTEDMAVVAQFDAATGAIKVYEQTFTTWSANGENYTDALYANFHYAGDENYEEGDYVNGRSDLIFTATLNGSKATLTPGSSDNGTFVSFQYYQVPASGNSIYVYNREGYPLPNTLTKASGSNVVQRAIRLSDDGSRTAAPRHATKKVEHRGTLHR